MSACPYVDLRDYEPPGMAVPPRPKRLFPIIPIDDIEIGKEQPFLIDKLLSATGLAIVFGLPKSGKSFLLSDALFHVAMGRPWANCPVLPGAVVYVSSEGVGGLKRRLVALRCHYDVEGERVPFAFVPVMPDMGHASGDADLLIETIRAWLQSIGNPPLRAVAFDTVARAMNGADENRASEMGVLIANAERVAEAFSCLVVLVHHAGKSAERGSRGSNALDGAADVMWLVEKGDAHNRVSITAMKDGEEGLDWTFRLPVYHFDEEGAQQSAATTCTVEILTNPGPAQQGAAKRSRKLLPASPAMLLAIINTAITDAGEFVNGDINVPSTERSIARELIKKYAKKAGYYEDGKQDNQNRAKLSSDLRRLKVDGYIGLSEQYAWLRHAIS